MEPTVYAISSSTGDHTPVAVTSLFINTTGKAVVLDSFTLGRIVVDPYPAFRIRTAQSFADHAEFDGVRHTPAYQDVAVAMKNGKAARETREKLLGENLERVKIFIIDRKMEIGFNILAAMNDIDAFAAMDIDPTDQTVAIARVMLNPTTLEYELETLGDLWTGLYGDIEA